MWAVRIAPDPTNGIYGVVDPHPYGSYAFTSFFADKKAAEQFRTNVAPLYAPQYLAPDQARKIYLILNKKNFQKWLNVAGTYQDFGWDTPGQDDFLAFDSPRGSGVNSIDEKSPKYGGKVQSAKGGTSATITISLGGYLQAIYDNLLAKGQIAHADMVRLIITAFGSGKISSDEALTKLQTVISLI